MDISKKLALAVGSLGLVAGAAGTIAMQTHAQTVTPTTTAPHQRQAKQRGTPPAAFGTVSSVNGDIITITDKKSNTSYTVDASNATIEKFNFVSGQKPTSTTVNVSQIAVGDQVTVEGTVLGTNIAATKIVDGMMGGPRGFMGHGPQGRMGTVTAVNGSSVTITGKNGQTYTIDASSATVKKVISSTVSDIQVGDQIMAQGSASGNTVTATEITDGQFGPHATNK